MFYPTICPLHLIYVCIINSSYTFKAFNQKLCMTVSGILKICMCLLKRKKIIFGKLTAFSDLELLLVLATTELQDCIIKSSHSLKAINLKLCIDVSDFLKICIPYFSGYKTGFSSL